MSKTSRSNVDSTWMLRLVEDDTAALRSYVPGVIRSRRFEFMKGRRGILFSLGGAALSSARRGEGPLTRRRRREESLTFLSGIRMSLVTSSPTQNGARLCRRPAAATSIRPGCCGWSRTTQPRSSFLYPGVIRSWRFKFMAVAQFAENSPAIDGWGKRFAEGANPAGTIEALPMKCALSSLRDFPCSGIGFPALKRWAIAAETEPLLEFMKYPQASWHWQRSLG